MSNTMAWNGDNPLSLRIKGSGEFVKKMCANLVDSFEDAKADHYEEIRQDNE